MLPVMDVRSAPNNQTITLLTTKTSPVPSVTVATKDDSSVSSVSASTMASSETPAEKASATTTTVTAEENSVPSVMREEINVENIPAPASSVSVAHSSSASEAHDDSVPLVKVKQEGKVAGEGKLLGNPIDTATMNDVVVSKDNLTPFVKINQRLKGPPDPAKCSRLSSIAGFAPSDINTGFLRKFCTRMSIRVVGGGSSPSKPMLVNAIIDAKENPPKESQQPTTTNEPNRKRYCNVIFSDHIAPLLARRGECLTKDEMTEGLKMDENLHREIVKDYNDDSKHNEEAWPDVAPACPHPSDFDGPLLWTQSAAELKDIIREHEGVFWMWKRSGNHSSFEEEEEEELKII